MEQFTQEMFKRLDALAAKLGIAASAIWQFYVRQARVEGLTDLAIGLLSAFLTVMLCRWAFKCWKKIHEDGVYSGFLILFSILAVVSVCIGFSYLRGAFTELYNPGYWAFQEILSQLNGQ